MSVPFLVQTDQGAAVPFCDFACFHTYAAYVDVGDVASGKRLRANRDVCFHCASCGRKIFKTGNCLLHGSDCPDWLWYGSMPIVTDFLDYHEKRVGSRKPAKKIWDAAEEVARVHPGLAGEDLAALTLKLVELLDEDDEEHGPQ